MVGKFAPPRMRSGRYLGKAILLAGSYSQAGLGQQAEPSWSYPSANISVPPHDTGFRLSPLLSQTQTAIAICTFMHWLLLWQSRMHLSLRSLKFFLGTRDIWSSREIIQTFLHSRWNLCKLQISQSLPPKKIHIKTTNTYRMILTNNDLKTSRMALLQPRLYRKPRRVW